MHSKNIRLPKEFKKYFWDVNFKKLSFRKNTDFILERVMRLGDIKALRWLLNIPKQKIKRVVEKSRELDPKTRNYWGVIYGR